MKADNMLGIVTDAQTGKPVPGANVAAWSTSPALNAPVATATSDANGRFELKFPANIPPEVVKQFPNIRFNVSLNNEILTGSYTTQTWNVLELKEEIHLVVDASSVSATRAACTIQGTVYSSRGEKLSGLQVKAFDRDLRSEEPLGEAVTDKKGAYRISYTRERFANNEYDTADILMRVYDGDKQLFETPTGDILYNAAQKVKIDIRLTQDPVTKLSEFETYQQRISPLTGKISFDQLEETTTHADITFLSKETGLDYAYLEYLVLSFKIEQQFKFLPQFFYAIFRQGSLLKTDLSQWLTTRVLITLQSDIKELVYETALMPEATIKTDIANAIKANIIPDISKRLPEMLKAVTALKDEATKYIQQERPQQWANLVMQSIDKGSYQDVVQLISKNAYGNLPQLLNSILAANPFKDAQSAGDTKININLAGILGTDDRVINHVKTAAGITDEKDLPKLAELHADDWKKMLSNIADPELRASVASNADQLNSYANILSNRFAKQYPNAAFKASFKRDDNHLFSSKDTMLAALDKAPEVDLGGKPIDTQVKHLQLDDDTRQQLRALQRLYKLTPDYAKAKQLHSDGLHSAYQVVGMGQKQFVKKYTANNTFGEQEAAALYQKAANVHTAAMHLGAELKDYASSGGVQALNGQVLMAKIEQISKDFPNLKSLFSEIDLCECDDCRSVYGPAAYLADVLQFLKNRMLANGTKTAKDVLFKRRPDIGELDLNCDNANTPIPYIDLVCEVLEDAVAPEEGVLLDSTYTPDMVAGLITPHLLSGLTTNAFDRITASAILYPKYNEAGVDTFILRDAKSTTKIAAEGTGWRATRLKQTHLTADELNAAPEYVNDLAYQTLQSSNISFGLPFDLYQQEADALLQVVGVNRADLMNTLANSAGPDATSIAAVYLKIPPAERALIVNADNSAASQTIFWSTGAQPPIPFLQEVDIFLNKSGLTYKDLQRLLTLSFINPGDTMFIQHLDSSCDTAKKLIANLDLDALDRIHRFLRLMRRTGIDMANLNRVIMDDGLGAQQLNDNTLVLLYGLLHLQNSLSGTLEQAIAFYGRMADDSDTALYQSVYLNRRVTKPVDDAFTLIKIAANEALPVASRDTLAAHLTNLALSLKLKPDDVTFLISKISGGDTTLTRDNMAFLYRNALLAKTFGLKVQDMYELSSIAGQPLFTSPADTNTFISTIQFIQSAGFTAADLRWYLQNDDTTGLLTLTDDTITTWLKGLQAAYQQAYTANKSAFDATLPASQNADALKQSISLLPNLTAQVVSKIMAIISGQFTDVLTPQAYVAANLNTYFDTTDAQNKITALLALPGGDPGIPAAQNNLVASLAASVSAYLYTQAKQTALYAATGATFGSTDVVTQVLLNNASLKEPLPVEKLISVLTTDTLVDQANTPPVLPAVNATAFDRQYRAVRLLKLMTTYINKLTISAKDLQWLLQNNAAMGWLELDTLRYQSDVTAADYQKWVKLQQALQLMQTYGTSPNPADATIIWSWTDVWNLVVTGAPKAGLQTMLAQFTGWDAADVSDLDTYFGYVFPDAYQDSSTYLQLDKATAALRLLGVPIAIASQFIKPVLTATEAGLITQALRNKYDEAQWLNVIQPVEDALRPQKRDALVAYLLASNPDLTSTDDLYDYFLMDVEMQPGQPSSRIVMAHGMVQLFVQRCLMALEPDAIADVTDDDGWAQWDWMKNFQVWVANRKIFLYPENWIEPELRTDKSYFFSDLISELQQNEITDNNVETAAIHYLEKLDDVATLDVRACYYDINTYTTHVIARVRGGSTYYYRTCTKERKWEPWTKVDVDISGDHLLAYMHSNRLFIAWHLPTEEVERTQQIDIPSTPISEAAPVPRKRYQIQLAVSELIDGVWQPKRTSQDYLVTDFMDEQDLHNQKDTFRMIDFSMGTVGYGILCTFNDYPIGMFNLAGCKGYPEVANWSEDMPYLDFIPDFKDTSFLQMQYKEKNNRETDTLAARDIFSPFAYETILNATPGTFRITYPHEFSLIDWIYVALETILLQQSHMSASFVKERGFVLPMASFMPFFYADNDREYVIIPGFFDENGSNERTFSDIYQFLTDLIAFVKKYLLMLIADPAHDLNKIKQEYLADPEYAKLAAEWDYYKNHKPQMMFRNFYHPLVCYIKSAVYNGGIQSIMTYEVQSKVNSFNFNSTYQPTPVVAHPYPVEDIDFTAEGSYSSYNWELFYHLPFYVANQLSLNQQFEEARKWYHYIFNPIGGAGGSAPQKYWITKPFHEFFDYADQRIDTIMNDIASDPTGTVYTDLTQAVQSWRENPFMPHEVARTRPLAYQKALLMNYLDNLIAWGDNLFMQNTMESLVQATQMYILADKLLGPKPQIIPPAVPVPDETYNQLESKLDSFSNALIDLENLVPDLNLLPHKGAELPPPPATLSSLYFCIPANANLLGYWDTIADRLFKIRNSEDINGVHRVLALFAPPIDPGMLVRATAAGLDISSVLSMLSAPLPIYRFTVLIQKATEFTEQVKALGNLLLSVLEKKDAESLALLKSTQEIKLQQQVLQIRQSQIDEAKQSIEVLNKTKDVAQTRFNFYDSRDFMNGWEIAQAGISGGAIISEIVATVLDATSGGTHMIPIITGGGAGFGGSPVVTVSFGGNNVGSSTASFASLFRGIAGILHSTAGLIGNIGSYQRRMDDWHLQRDIASGDMAQIDQQIVVANIRKDIASKEFGTQQTRISQAQEVDTFLKTKYTNKDLYSWMLSQLSTVYYQSYKLAFDMAQKAQQCYQYELANDSTFIQYGYWDTMKKGLLSGDQLLTDIKKMESAYYDNNRREFELTKSVSLASLSPEALMQLRNTGQCDFSIPEMLFDMDYPGQYLRRIKTVSLTVPCVAGPLTTVACTLSQVSNKYRKNTLLKASGADAYDKYAENTEGDDRFVYNIGSIQSIATSHAQNDAGMFEVNFRDERYLPFEGTGAVSSWHLEMTDPSVLSQFDYQTITDVIINVGYTSRPGGGAFKQTTTDYLKLLFKKLIAGVPVAGLYRMFDLKHEMPNNWYAFMNDGSATFSADISKANLPFYTQNSGLKVTVQSAALFVLTTGSTPITVSINGGAAAPLGKDATRFGSQIQFIDPVDTITGNLLSADDKITASFNVQSFAAIKSQITDAWVVLNYTLG
ncbi:virulence plasmid A protein [Mucilaginibacter yixingensis]|uniref:Virulence plasmid A protein n=1 Tax=Mucilaginibacter yixingensis TaxID=1295612 RepID=A0A2T5JBS5_9SPHI|nr:neuraminidase-like domain-containing protein [Mucilaginibacter yixingensis]PTQ98229.1 virulence plasmid A protein [Mucilaginibacter yixingensis]